STTSSGVLSCGASAATTTAAASRYTSPPRAAGSSRKSSPATSAPSSTPSPRSRPPSRRRSAAWRRSWVSANLVALERCLIEREPESGLRGYEQLAVIELRRFFPKPQRPRHVFDREAVGDRRDQMHVQLGDEMADHGQIERLRHTGDLHPLRDAARAQQI